MTRKASRAELAFISSLHRTALRREHRLFLAEGSKALQELLASRIQIKMIACTVGYLDAHPSLSPSIDIITVSESELQRISTLSTPNQVLAVCHMPDQETLDIQPSNATYLLLDNINDPGNLGTMIRTAEWFGVKAVITSPNSVDLWNPKVVQSSMGSLFRMPVYQQPLVATIADGKRVGVDLVVGGVLGGQSLSSINRNSDSMMLVIGSESHGISDDVLQNLTAKISISHAPGSPTESLNASVAAGILLQHFCGQ
jgi:RNA methyltransferase, TrmH family